MAESTLARTYDDLRVEVADKLRLSRDSAAWSTDDGNRITSCIKAGLADFYGRHDWSFLKPHATIDLWSSIAVGATTATGVYSAGPDTSTVTATAPTFLPSMPGRSIVITDIGTFTIVSYTSATVIVVAGNATCSGKTFSIAADGDYRMPDDFAGVFGDMHYQSGGYYGRMSVVSENQILRKREGGPTTGTPTWAAVRPISPSSTIGQRWDLMVYPTPGGSYSLHYRYRVLPGMPTTGQYPYGGAAHAETILAACLYAAERRLNDGGGVSEAEYLRLVEQSIRLDAATTGPRVAQGAPTGDPWAPIVQPPATYNGEYA